MDNFQAPFIILGNGSVPKAKIPLDLISKAGTRICLDGGGDKLLHLGYDPDIILGDFDSTNLVKKPHSYTLKKTHNQSKSDLEKCLDWCLENKIIDLTLLGLVGERDDHTFVNLLLLNKFRERLNLKLVTDFQTISCIAGKHEFKSFTGQVVSILGTETIEDISTTGLKYELENATLNPGTRGVSNSALNDTFQIFSSQPVWVFLSHRS